MSVDDDMGTVVSIGAAAAAGATTIDAATAAIIGKPARRRCVAGADETHGLLNIIVLVLVVTVSAVRTIGLPKIKRGVRPKKVE